MDSAALPFVGPRPFKREDAPLFFGRDREGNELLSLIVSHTEVLLYAQSGAGKTSLINAKLWNLLEEEGLEVLPVARMQGPPTSALPRSKIRNIYVFNTLVKWLPQTTAIQDLGELTLREVLEKREHALDEEGTPKPFVAIFDQFEELFTAYPECWEQRRDFFQQLRDALDALPRLRVLFAMREDYLGAMDPYAAIMPEKLRVRFHLENLRKRQAIEAIENPLTRGPVKRRFAPGVAERLAEELMKVEVETPDGHTESVIGEFVEPVQLQVVCERLWRDLKPEDSEITLAHLETISVEKALLSFYDESIQAVADQTGMAERTLRSWFENKMITPAGTRGIAFRGEKETEGLPNEAIDALDQLHLIRSELRGGKQWYELMHDRFIDAIQSSRQRLILGLESGADERRKQLEDKATKWVSQGRKKSGLLVGADLEAAERWLASPAASALGTSEILLALADASRAEVQARSARRRTGVIVVLTLALALALGMTFHARRQSIEAQRQRGIAETKTAELNESQEVLSEIYCARNLAGTSLKYRQRDLGLALLLNVEAGRIAHEIKPKTPAQSQANARLTADMRAGLVAGLVFAPHLRTFLTGHSKMIRDIAYNRDGRILATGSNDGTVILWDSRGYPLGSPLKGHNGAVFGVAFSPDDKMVASCGGDGIVNFWNLERPEEHKTVTVGQDAVRKIAFAPDGKTLACATDLGTVVLLDVAGHGEKVTLPAHTGATFAVAFSPDGKTFASAGVDKKIIFWNFATRTAAGSVEDDDEVFSLAFSPDGKLLASGNRALKVTLWDVGKRERSGAPLKGHVDSIFGVAFTPDGKALFSASLDKTIRRWDVAKRTLMGEPLIGSGQAVYCLAVHPNGKTIASGAEGGVATVWDLRKASVIADSLGLDGAGSVAAVTSDGSTIAVADDYKGNVSVLGPTVDETFKVNLEGVRSLAFSPDGTVLASVGDDNIIQLRTWNGTTWNTPKRSLPAQPQSINRLAFNPTDNNILASGQGDGSTLLWNLANGQAAAGPVKLHSDVTALAWSRDGKKLAAGGNAEIALWNGVSSQQVGPEKMHKNAVLGLAFSPDGRLLASGSDDADVILWDAETRQFAHLLREHQARVRGVSFSPDGQVLASCSDDKSIILWDVGAGTSIQPLVTNDFPFNVFFLPTGDLLSSGGDVINWGISMESLQNKAEEVSARNLTGEEWKYFMGKRPYRPTSIYGSTKEADMLALQNRVEEARTAFQQVVSMAAGTKNAGVNNEIGWYGSLDGFAEIVKPACDRALQLARPEEKVSFQDSRGLANALTGKFSEAAEDFKAFVDWSKSEEEFMSKNGEDSRTVVLWKHRRERREAWISQILSGHNPFDAETLKTLRMGEALPDE